MSDSFATPWTVTDRLLWPCDFTGKNTGMGCHFLLQGIFPIQGSNMWLTQSILSLQFSSAQFSHSVVSICDSMNCSMPGLPVHQQLPEFTKTHVPWISDIIRRSHSLSLPSLPAFNLSQHQGLFKWDSSSHQVAKVLEFQLQHQSFQWTPRTDLL